MLLKSVIQFNKRHARINKYALLAIPKSVLLVVCAIFGTSIACLYSACGGTFCSYATKQIFYIIIMFPVFLMIIMVNVKYIKRYAYLFYIFNILMLIAVFFIGHSAMGASRWIDFGFIKIQPSELMKVAVVLAIAKFLSNTNALQIAKISTTIKVFAMIFVPFILVAIQPDLTTSVIMLIITLSMLFLAGTSIWQFLFGGIVFVCLAPFVWMSLLKDYQKLRIVNFLNPANDPLGSGYNIIQSKIAIGSGGLTGKGFLQGTQGQLRFLPEHHTDFIYTIIGEEAGFVGSMAVLLMFVYLIFYGFKVAKNTHSTFGKLVILGCTTILFLHTFINIGMVCAIMPAAGIPLLMVSYGGSSLALGLFCVALIINIDINKDVV